jgi:hypothetical protein
MKNNAPPNLGGYTGFILEKLIIKNNIVFGEHFEMTFFEKEKFTNSLLEAPFTTLIIGPNGTGKSLILQTICDIFLEIASLEKKERVTYEYFQISFYINSDYYVFSNFNDKTNFDSKKKVFVYSLQINDEPEDIDKIHSPEVIIAVSILLSDKFTIYKNSPENYKYLGVRSLTSEGNIDMPFAISLPRQERTYDRAIQQESRPNYAGLFFTIGLIGLIAAIMDN